MNIIDIDYGFLPNICPLCGSFLLDMDELAGDVISHFSNELSHFSNEFERQLLDRKEQLDVLVGRLEKLESLESKNIPTGWIYIKIWQERSWISVKPGKTRDLERRTKGYDDHDYILNLCAPVPYDSINEYEKYLGKVLFDFLIPFVIHYRNNRLQEKLGRDYQYISLNDGLAEGRKEYYRLFVDIDSIEFDFLYISLKTFFGGLVSPGNPIDYDEWINYIKKTSIKNGQKNIFDELGSNGYE